MTVSLATSLVTFALTFTGVVSFAVTAFGGDIIFQLGWQMCSIVAPNVCSGHLLVTLGMMSLLGFIKLPIQLLVLRADVNYQLGIRMAIYQITGVTLGLYILTTFGSDLLFKKMFGLFLFFLAVWYLRKELEVYHNASHPVVKPGYEATSDFPTDLEMRSSFLGAFPSSPSSSHSLSPSPSNEDKMPSRSYDNKDYDKEDTNLVPRLPRTMTSYTEGDNYIELKDGKVVSLETPRTSKRRSQLQIDTVSMELKVACFGLMSGILGGIYGTGGPPLMVFASSTGINKDEWRATSAFCHSFENIVRAYYVIYIRRVISFNDERFLLVGLTVTVLLGLLVGNLLSGKVSAALWRQIILLLLMMGSAAMMSAGSPGQEALGLFVLVVTSYALLFLVFRHSYDVALYLRVRSALGIEKGLPFPR